MRDSRTAEQILADRDRSLARRSETGGIQMDINLDRQEITIHVTPKSIATLRRALDDAERGGKVFIGDKPLLIIRPVGWKASNA